MQCYPLYCVRPHSPQFFEVLIARGHVSRARLHLLQPSHPVAMYSVEPPHCPKLCVLPWPCAHTCQEIQQSIQAGQPWGDHYSLAGEIPIPVSVDSDGFSVGKRARLHSVAARVSTVLWDFMAAASNRRKNLIWQPILHMTAWPSIKEIYPATLHVLHPSFTVTVVVVAGFFLD